jgi:hypothetical protein
VNEATPPNQPSALCAGRGARTPQYVKVTTGGMVICVVATLENDPNGNSPIEVRLRVYPCSTVPPPDPPPDALPATPTGVDPSGYACLSNWEHLCVPACACQWPGTGQIPNNNRLAIWRKYPGDLNWRLEQIEFAGECSNHTDCEQEASMRMAGQGSHVLDTVSDAWRLEAAGFRGVLSPLNGTWLLGRFPQVVEGGLTWVCGGDGRRVPRAELSASLCGCGPIELRLTCGGTRVIYQARREEFNPLGGNRFFRAADQDIPPGAEAPGEIIIFPG